MKSETGLWIIVGLLIVAVITLFFMVVHKDNVSSGLELSAINGAVNVCSDNSLSKALVCTTSNTEMIITGASNSNELQHFINNCDDVKIIDAYNCVGKTFTITGGNSSGYVVN